ncbi:rCG62154 [Rattus norvegicus]|uniref:RCG62154 n=1 Tax=Rattus norvegicus TaxID=10116 RepID=A6HC58_RAT|nr:rCG62154 [Rattus norvegicus]
MSTMDLASLGETHATRTQGIQVGKSYSWSKESHGVPRFICSYI